MNTTLVAIGFAMVIILIALLLSGKTVPMVAFVLVSFIGALLAGFSLPDISTFVGDGVKTVINSVGMAMFATAFFTIMTSIGVFDPLVRFLSKYAGNVTIIFLITYLIATVGHFDTGTTSTILLTIPMMLPLYRKFHIRVEWMFLMIGMAVAMMNLLPMGGGIIGLSAVSGIDAGVLFQQIVPVIAIGWGVNIIMIVLVYSKMEKKRIAKMSDESKRVQDDEYRALLEVGRKGTELQVVKMNLKYWANLILTLVTITVVFLDIVRAYFVFMIAFMIALLINYKGNKAKQDVVKLCAGNCYPIAAVMMCAGVFVGVMSGSGMLTEMAGFIVSLIPDSMHGVYNVLLAVICTPMSIALGSQAYYYGFSPLLLEVGTTLGVSTLSTIATLQITQNAFGFITPVSAVNHLACGMLGRDIKDVFRFCFPKLLLMLAIQFTLSIVVGLIAMGA